MTVTVSKITRAGQITLPKRIRSGKAFAHAKAVLFVDRGNEVIIKPLQERETGDIKRDYLPFAEYTTRDWLDSANDDLFAIQK